MFTSICKYGVFGSSSPLCSVSSWGYVNCGLFNYFKLVFFFVNFLELLYQEQELKLILFLFFLYEL